jgi:hypothetical protein
MFQSGHSNLDDPASYRFNKGNRTLIPVKPTLNGEPCYEDHPVNWLRDGEYRWFDDSDTRKAAYWAIFSGACGHTYGNHNIWQMWQPDLDPISWARTDWRIALNHPGSWQMKYLKEFFESIEWQKFTPDQSVILNENNENEKYQMAMTSGDNTMIIAYTPYGEEINLNLSSVKNKMWEAYWFNPRDGNISPHKGKEGKSNRFKPLSHGRGSDWVLLIKCKP